MSGEMKILLLATTPKRHHRDARSQMFGGRKVILTVGLGLLVIVSAGALAIAVVGSMNSPVDRSMPVTSQPPKQETRAAAEPKNSEYRQKLTEEQFYVTREKGTERPFSGKYWNHKETGTYACVCCGAPLFESQHKFDHGDGWPSFDRPVDDRSVKTVIDQSLLQTRMEVMCRRCNAHLGHVYDDGPTATRQRYSINSAALDFKEAPADAGTPTTGH